MSTFMPRPRTFSTLGDYFTCRQEPGRAGLPTLSVTMHDGLVHRDELERRTESTLAPEQHLLVRKGDIAYNMMRMWQGACGLAEMDAIVSPAYVVLTPKGGIDGRFAVHWFKSPRMLYLLWAYSHGLTEDRLRLYFDDFCQIPAIPPPLDEQCRIATILGTWEQAIESTSALITVRSRLRLTALNRLFVTAGGKANRWSECVIGDVVNSISIRGHQVQTSAYADGGKWPIVDQSPHQTVGWTSAVPPIKPPLQSLSLCIR